MTTNKENLSERDLAALTGVSRTTIRKALYRPMDCKLRTLELLAKAKGLEFDFSFVPEIGGNSEHSVVGSSLKIRSDGFDSWRLHIMNFIDEFRRSHDRRLLVLSPVPGSDERIVALYAGIVKILCQETNILVPHWAKQKRYCAKPWFVSGSESLKASALIESPIEFRSQNIYVHENFLSRV